MRLLYKLITISIIFCTITVVARAQQTDVPPAQFDVLVKVNGEIITARVIEVGIKTVRYKRTDIPDGPIYEVLRSDIYAISYRNQLKEFLTPIDSTKFRTAPVTVMAEPVINPEPLIEVEPVAPITWYANMKQGELRLGYGFIRNYSKIKNVNELNAEAGATAIQLAYLYPYRNNIHIGLLTGIGNFKYSESSFSEYDQLQINQTSTESLFTVAVVGMYARKFNLITPYLMGGLAFYSSMIKSNGSFNYVDNDRTVLVKNSARNNGLGVVVRVGLDVTIIKKVSGYVDFGNGLTLGQVGLILKR
jgi:hypothetical protein